jgi:hypothetical protein
MNDHIQISDVTPRIQYAANGSQTEFSYPFPIFVEDDLEVYVGDTRETSGYAVLGAGTSYGGTVTFETPPTNGVVVTLRRSLAIERTTDFHQSGAFRAKVINDELDHLTAALQQVANDVSRAVRLRSTAADASLELPSKDDRANKVLGFDASGDVIAISDGGGAGGGVTNHGQLTGLSDDDHGQYHNNARGDARYYTQAQVDTALGDKSDTTHNHDSAYAAISHVDDTNNPHGVTKSHVGLGNVENIKFNLIASVDPTQNNDGNDGYTAGSRWINTAADREFVCLDAALGAAVWVETTQIGDGGISDHGALTGLGDDDHTQYHNDARGDARYYTQAQVDSALGDKSDTTHDHDAAYAAISHVSDYGNPHGVTKFHLGLGNVENLKTNLSANADPTQTNDSGGGYDVGSRWINSAAAREFVCLDAAPGAAVWAETTQTGGVGVSDHGVLTGLGDDDHPQYFLRSAWFPSLMQTGGATGDGATDDSSAWDTFIDAAIAAGGGLIEPGVYRIPNATMQKRLPPSFHLLSLGGREKTVLDYEADRDTVALDDSTVLFWIEGNDIRIDGVQFRRVPIVFAASDATYTGFNHNSFTTSGNLSGLTIERCKFDRTVYPLWVRSQNDAAYFEVKDFMIRDNAVLDSAYGFHFMVLDLHRTRYQDNYSRLTHARTLSATEQGMQINALALDTGNSNETKEVLAQQTERSGQHLITGNVFAGINWTGAGPATNAEMQHVRVTLQNGVVLDNNFFGTILAPNHDAAIDFDVEMVYLKVIQASVTNNVFDGQVAGATAIDNAMLRLKGNGIFASGSTLDHAHVVTGNHFRGSGAKEDDDNLRAALDIYSNNHFIGQNTFEDLYLKDTLRAAIMSHNSLTGSVIQNNTFHRLRTASGSQISAIQIYSGGINVRIDGVLCIEPCDDNVGSQFRGVLVTATSDEVYENWRIGNVCIVSASPTPNNRCVAIDGNNRSGTYYKGMTIYGLSCYGSYVDIGVFTYRVPSANVERFRIVECDFTGMVTPISNLAAIPMQIALPGYTETTASTPTIVNNSCIRNNFEATADPGATDDSGDGYAVGSRWINQASNQEFVCVDTTASSAVWKQTTT